MIATGDGLLCPKCGSAATAVCDSRAGPGFIRRRRKCTTCTEWNRFSTLEMIVESPRHHYVPEPIFQALKLQSAIDALPPRKRDLVLGLVAAFTADEVK